MTALLTHGADPNARVTRNVPRFGSSAWRIYGGASPAGATPFFFAASVGDVKVMRFLLAKGADPHLATEDNTTPLMAAAGLAVEESETRIPEARHLEAVRVLIDLGADVRSANKQGDTALHGAAFLGYNEVLQLLLDRGAALNARNKQGQTPYRIALGIMVNNMFFQHPNTAAMLKNAGGVE
jgi:ankyrin repeat protein